MALSADIVSFASNFTDGLRRPLFWKGINVNTLVSPTLPVLISHRSELIVFVFMCLCLPFNVIEYFIVAPYEFCIN